MDTFAFDDCSIFHLCQLKPRAAFSKFFGSQISHKHFEKLSSLLRHARQKNIERGRFVPAEEFDANVMKSYSDLLEKFGNVQILGHVFKKEMIEQLMAFYESIKQEFQEILKSDDIRAVKQLIEQNKRQLKKGRSMPGEDDLKIIVGYAKHQAPGKKFLISEDEDFWGYKDLYQREFKIFVVEEWNCHQIIV